MVVVYGGLALSDISCIDDHHVAKRKSDGISKKYRYGNYTKEYYEKHVSECIESVYRGHRCELALCRILNKYVKTGFDLVEAFKIQSGSNTGKDICKADSGFLFDIECKSTNYIDDPYMFITSKYNEAETEDKSKLERTVPYWQNLFKNRPLFMLVHETPIGHLIYKYDVVSFAPSDYIINWYDKQENKSRSLSLKNMCDKNRLFRGSIVIPSSDMFDDGALLFKLLGI